MRKWLLRLLVLALLVGGGVALRRTVWADPPIAVRAVEARGGRVEATVTNSRAGTVRARRRADLSPESAGRVVEVAHREGERVEAGAVLVRLDAETQRARLEYAQRTLEAVEAQHAEARVRLEQTEREVQRSRRLAEQRVITTDVLERAESAFEAALATARSAAARVAQARAEVALAATELEKTVLRAPFAGLVAEVSVELGEWVTPAPPLMQVPGVIDLIDPSSIYVSAPMDEVDSAVIRPGQPARVTLDPFPERSFAGEVVRVAAYVLDVEAQNRTIEVEVALADPALAATLLPGTSADVEVILAARDDVLRVPTEAVIERTRVLVVEGDTLVERRIRTGLWNWEWTEVQEGLEPGARVVTSLGREAVAAGATVTVEPAGP